MGMGDASETNACHENNTPHNLQPGTKSKQPVFGLVQKEVVLRSSVGDPTVVVPKLSWHYV
jgi:hypothetical protein